MLDTVHLCRTSSFHYAKYSESVSHSIISLIKLNTVNLYRTILFHSTKYRESASHSIIQVHLRHTIQDIHQKPWTEPWIMDHPHLPFDSYDFAYNLLEGIALL